MAIAVAPEMQEQVILLSISWETYEAIAVDVVDDNQTFLAYDGHTLELMSPLSDHEAYVKLLDVLLTLVMIEWEINLYNTGATTLKARPLAAEPDTSYYVQHAIAVDGIKRVDLATSPPPDLVVEVDISHRRMDKLGLYAKLGVPEFWRYGRDGLKAFALVDDAYAEVTVSRVIPGLPLQILAEFLERRLESNRRSIIRDWQEWLRGHRPNT